MFNIYGQLPRHPVQSATSGSTIFETDVAASIRRHFRVNFARMLDDLKARNIDQKAFAKLVELSPPVISQLKSGKFFPSPELLQKLAEAGGMDPSDLIKDPTKTAPSVHEMAKFILETAGFKVIKPVKPS